MSELEAPTPKMRPPKNHGGRYNDNFKGPNVTGWPPGLERVLIDMTLPQR
jgi:hypothetical protein